MPLLAFHLVALAIALTFAWAALAKSLRFPDWRAALGGYGLSERVQRIAAPSVPIVELAVAVLIASVSVRSGAALALALLSAFSLAVLRAQPQTGDKLPCGCFGRAKERDYRLVLARNSLLAVLSAAVLLSGREVALLDAARLPRGDQLIAAILLLAGVAVALWTVRQVTLSLSNKRHA